MERHVDFVSIRSVSSVNRNHNPEICFLEKTRLLLVEIVRCSNQFDIRNFILYFMRRYGNAVPNNYYTMITIFLCKGSHSTRRLEIL